ncbi:MAG: MlaD family protein [Phycisphaerae bacterium]|nr:MlaD family protein [Phycisphaerae bacterium]
MRESIRNFSIGIVSAVGLTGLAALLLLFGELSFLEDRTPVDIALNSAGGLRKGSLVTLHGVPVGLIDRVQIDADDPRRPVRVRAMLDHGTRVPAPASPTVEASLLGSGAKLELQGNGSIDTGTYYPTDGVPLLAGEFMPIDQRLLAALDQRLATVMESLASFDEFATTYTALGRDLNDLVRPLDPGNPHGPPSEASLRTTVIRVNRALASADEAIALAQTWLGDEALRTDVKAAAGNANELFERATDTVNVIGGLAANLDADRAALVMRLLPVVDEARAALSEVRRLIDTATNGDGTVGRLLNDPKLFNDLADSAKRLSAAMAAIQAVAEKLKAEGIVLKF